MEEQSIQVCGILIVKRFDTFGGVVAATGPSYTEATLRGCVLLSNYLLTHGEECPPYKRKVKGSSPLKIT